MGGIRVGAASAAIRSPKALGMLDAQSGNLPVVGCLDRGPRYPSCVVMRVFTALNPPYNCAACIRASDKKAHHSQYPQQGAGNDEQQVLAADPCIALPILITAGLVGLSLDLRQRKGWRHYTAEQ